MRTLQRDSHSRGGYTLFEMLMVQGLLVMLVAASYPMLRSPLGKNQLLDAARQIRVELVKARHQAIETGVTQQFRFQPRLSAFEVTPAATPATEEPAAVARDVSRISIGGTPGAPGHGEASDPVERRGELPDGVRFGESAGSASEAIPDDSAEVAAAPRPDRDTRLGAEVENWSAPILFYPNGRTSNAKIPLQGKGHFEVEVALRGLTGIPTVGEVRRVDEERR